MAKVEDFEDPSSRYNNPRYSGVPNRTAGRSIDLDKPMLAKCGHPDRLGYFTGTVCGKCARKAHKKAMGN